MTRRRIPLLFLLLLSLPSVSGCPSPAAPPAPPAEIPSFLTVPRDLSIDVDELPGSSGTAGLKLIASPRDVAAAIELATETIKESNQLLDFSLIPASQTDIPVSASVFTFQNKVLVKEDDPSTSVDIKFDFGRFDLDGVGGLESCSGCTCPVDCAPNLAICPREVSEADLKPICFRVWINGTRFMAGVFDRIPTKENPQSGRFRILLPFFTDLGGSEFEIQYDHSDPNDRQTALSMFLKDEKAADSGEEFFANRRAFGRIEGPEATALKTSRLTTSFISPPSLLPGLLQFQGRYFSHLDYIGLEVLADGAFSNDPEVGFFGLADISPPICVQITTANPVSDILCTDLGLTLTQGDFEALPVFEDVQMPPFSEFPEAPTFD